MCSGNSQKENPRDQSTYENIPNLNNKQDVRIKTTECHYTPCYIFRLAKVKNNIIQKQYVGK